MKLLVAGLGSMGKRRVRNLRALGVTDIVGFDLREDRRSEAATQYGIDVVASLDDALARGPDAVVVSVPPHRHVEIASRAVSAGCSYFLEASVVDDGLATLIERTDRAGLVGVPSNTMCYFSGPKRIKALVGDDAVGRPLHYVYHSGQYLPDWHPWESISDFYVSMRETGGCREIVPFELVWLVDTFGDVRKVRGRNTRIGDLDADIDDLYVAELEHASGAVGTLVVDVLARPARRQFHLTGTRGALWWDGVAGRLTKSAESEPWTEVDLTPGNPQPGYLYPEEPYIEEMRSFLECVRTGGKPGYSLADDGRILQILYAIERSCREDRTVSLA